MKNEYTKTGRIRKKYCKKCGTYLPLADLTKSLVCRKCRRNITRGEYARFLLEHGWKNGSDLGDAAWYFFKRDSGWYANTYEAFLYPDYVRFVTTENGSHFADRGRMEWTSKYKGHLLHGI